MRENVVTAVLTLFLASVRIDVLDGQVFIKLVRVELTLG